jgi:hypothetical protein
MLRTARARRDAAPHGARCSPEVALTRALAWLQVKAAVEFWGAHYEELEDVAHDVMLDTHWERGAEALHRWLAVSFPRTVGSNSQSGGTNANAPASEQMVA